MCENFSEIWNVCSGEWVVGWKSRLIFGCVFEGWCESIFLLIVGDSEEKFLWFIKGFEVEVWGKFGFVKV